ISSSHYPAAHSFISSSISLSTIPPPPSSPLFPYTTLFRSRRCTGCRARAGHSAAGDRWPARDRARRGRAGYSRRRCRRWQPRNRSEEHTSELQSLTNLVCRLLLEKKKKDNCRLEYRDNLVV